MTSNKKIPVVTSPLRDSIIAMPSCIKEASGIIIYGKRIKSIVYSLDVSLIANTNADAILCVYPFTPNTQILNAVSLVAKAPILVGVGGSASNDGGIGLAAGLGYEFFDADNHRLRPIGSSLEKVARISAEQVPDFLKEVKIEILTDVDNPLCGARGATTVFGGQKGLSPLLFSQVDQAMADFYQLVNPQVIDMGGAGAGGGMAAGLVAFAGGKIVSGIETCLDLLDFDERVKKADLVVVGEGRMDRQSLAGKAPIGVARRTPEGIPVLAICGSLADDLPDFPVENIQAAFPIIARADSLDRLLEQAEQNLIRTARNIGNVLKMKKSG